MKNYLQHVGLEVEHSGATKVNAPLKEGEDPEKYTVETDPCGAANARSIDLFVLNKASVTIEVHLLSARISWLQQ